MVRVSSSLRKASNAKTMDIGRLEQPSAATKIFNIKYIFSVGQGEKLSESKTSVLGTRENLKGLWNEQTCSQ